MNYKQIFFILINHIFCSNFKKNRRFGSYFVIFFLKSEGRTLAPPLLWVGQSPTCGKRWKKVDKGGKNIISNYNK
jgi:hypothetical protein